LKLTMTEFQPASRIAWRYDVAPVSQIRISEPGGRDRAFTLMSDAEFF